METKNTLGALALVAGALWVFSRRAKGKEPTPVPPTPVPSSLLVGYQEDLAKAIEMIKEGDSYNRWINVEGWGLQYPYTIVNGGLVDAETGEATSLSVKDLMIEEAMRLAIIAEPGEVYFDEAVMYHVNGNAIVPYWWICPYCGEKFRSPQALEEHKQQTHWNILTAKGSVKLSWTYGKWHESIENMKVSWTNLSSFSMQGYVKLDWYNWQGGGHRAVTTLAQRTAESGQTIVYPLDFDSLHLSERGIFKATLIGIADSQQLMLAEDTKDYDILPEE